MNPVLVQFVPVQTGIEEKGLNNEWLSVAPTPVRGRLVLNYTLPMSGSVHLAVYDPAGRTVAVLEDGFRVAGRHGVSWSAARVPAGVYIARLETGSGSVARRFCLVR